MDENLRPIASIGISGLTSRPPETGLPLPTSLLSSVDANERSGQDHGSIRLRRRTGNPQIFARRLFAAPIGRHLRDGAKFH